MAFAPDLFVQAGQGYRVTEQGQAFTVVETGRADLQRVTHTLGTQVLDRLGLGMASSLPGAFAAGGIAGAQDRKSVV